MNNHLVYRAFDDYGLLLYIGCTGDLAKRMKAHERSSPWFRFMSTIGAGEKRDMYEAFDMEREAIESEGSYFNATLSDQSRTSRSLHAANRVLANRGDVRPDTLDDATTEEEYLAWFDRRDRMRIQQIDLYPFVDARMRMQRYLAAREDAELARLEAAA